MQCSLSIIVNYLRAHPLHGATGLDRRRSGRGRCRRHRTPPHRVAEARPDTAARPGWAHRRRHRGELGHRVRSTPPPVRGHFPCSPHCCARKKVAEELAAHGARVVLACRTAERAHEAASSIATATGCLPELLHPAEVRTSSACAREVLVSPPLWLRSTSATWPACVPSQNAAPPSGAGSTSSSTMLVSCCPRCGPPSRLASGAPSRWRLLLPSVAATRERARNGAHSGHQLLRAFPPHPVPPSAAESHRRGAQRNVVAEAGGLTRARPLRRRSLRPAWSMWGRGWRSAAPWSRCTAWLSSPANTAWGEPTRRARHDPPNNPLPAPLEAPAFLWRPPYPCPAPMTGARDRSARY